MREYGMVFLDEKSREYRPSSIESGSLYLGEIPQFSDFFGKWDIPYPDAARWAKNIIENPKSEIFIIHGNPYVGKTCVALRLVVDLFEQGFFAVSFSMNTSLSANQYERVLLDFLSTLPKDSNCVVFAEHMSHYYLYLKHIIERKPQNIRKLVLVVTANSEDHFTKKYLLDRCDYVSEHVILHNIPKRYALNIYNKLDEKSHLNKLRAYAEEKKACLEFMQKIDDIVEVLYISQEGRKFIQHFEDWIKIGTNISHKRAFAILCFFAELGAINFPITYFIDILTLFGLHITDDFYKEYSDYLKINNGEHQIRCFRIIKNVIFNVLNSHEKRQIIFHAAGYFAKFIKDPDVTVHSEIFQKLIKVKKLFKSNILTAENILELLISLENPCKHISYYWIQKGIAYRRLNNFEEANNSFEQAAHVRGQASYHIKHAQAKNYMTWGVWAQKESKSRAQYYFEHGRDMVRDLITNSPHSYFAYSVHTYVDMSIRYYKDSENTIDTEEVAFMFSNLDLLSHNSLDQYSKSLSLKLVDFCQKKKIPFDNRFSCNMNVQSDEFIDADDL